jgi:DNA anti-recombination protein RmuC
MLREQVKILQDQLEQREKERTEASLASLEDVWSSKTTSADESARQRRRWSQDNVVEQKLEDAKEQISQELAESREQVQTLTLQLQQAQQTIHRLAQQLDQANSLNDSEDRFTSSGYLSGLLDGVPSKPPQSTSDSVESNTSTADMTAESMEDEELNSSKDTPQDS